MMKLGLMKRFFDTVSPDWRSPLLDEIAAPWLEDAVPVYILRASANFVAVLETPAGKFVLRFNHTDERSVPGIAVELKVVTQLAEHGLRAAQPVESRTGRLVESIPTALGVFHAVLFERLPGPHLDFEALDLPGFARWGQVVGAVHRAGQGLRVTGRPSWEDWLATFRRDVPLAETLAWRELTAVESALRALLQTAANFGLIHYDLELDNLCWEGETAGVIDFDDCTRHWLAADIAFALRDLFGDSAARVDLADARFQAFVGGYRAEHAIEPVDLSQIPLFLRFHNLVSFARISRSLAEGPLPDEPPWLVGLRQHLGQILERSRQDFAAHPLESLKI